MWYDLLGAVVARMATAEEILGEQPSKSVDGRKL